MTSFPSSKKPPFEKRTSSNDKTKVSYRKVGSKDIWNFLPESTIVKCHFYRLKNSFWENNIMKRQSQGCFYRKVVLKDIWNLWTESQVSKYGNFGVWTFHTRLGACMESAMRLDCTYNSLSFIGITQFSRLTAS